MITTRCQCPPCVFWRRIGVVAVYPLALAFWLPVGMLAGVVVAIEEVNAKRRAAWLGEL